MATLRGALLPQRVDGSADGQGKGGGGDAQGHPRPGRCRSGEAEGLLIIEKLRAMELTKAAEIVENGIDETLSYYKLAAGTPALSAHQQPAGTADARDPATNASSRGLPRRQLRADVGGRSAPPCRLEPMGNQTLSPDGPARRDRRHRLTALLCSPMGEQSKNNLHPTTFLSDDQKLKCGRSGHHLTNSASQSSVH